MHHTWVACGVCLSKWEAGWEIRRALLSPLPMAGLSGWAELSNDSFWVVGVGVESSIGEDGCSCKCNKRVWPRTVQMILNGWYSVYKY